MTVDMYNQSIIGHLHCRKRVASGAEAYKLQAKNTRPQLTEAGFQDILVFYGLILNSSHDFGR